MAFKTSLIVEDDFGLPYTLWADLVYESGSLKRTIVVPKGFRTDLASIPPGFWNLMPKSSRYDRAGVVHDYLYQFNGCTREEADNVLREAMDDLEVGRIRKWIIFHGVRVGGWKSWKRYRKEQEAQSVGQTSESVGTVSRGAEDLPKGS